MKKREVEEAKKSQPDSISLFGSQRLVCVTRILITGKIYCFFSVVILYFIFYIIVCLVSVFLHVCLAFYRSVVFSTYDNYYMLMRF